MKNSYIFFFPNWCCLVTLNESLYRVVTLRPEEVLADDAVYGDVPGPHHHAVALLAAEVSPTIDDPAVFA